MSILSDCRPGPGYAAVPEDGGADASAEPVSWYLSCKAAVDVALAAVLLVLCSPVLLVLMIAVKLTSRGPALYMQERLGRGGRPFTIYKLRTMAQDCERQSGPRWATVADPRATPLGRALRRNHLDELPQLWNVLRGEMSLVGPRPERPVFVAQLERAIPEYRGRLLVRPGVTGLAQVQLPADTDLEGVGRKVACDLCYIDRMSPGLDARIVLATGLKVVGVPGHLIGRLLRLPGVKWTVEPELEAAPELQTA